MSDYQDLKNSISALYSSSNIKNYFNNRRFTYFIWFILTFTFWIQGLWITIKASLYHDVFYSIILLPTFIILSFLTLANLICLLRENFNYRHSTKYEHMNPLSIRTKEDFNTLLFSSTIDRLIKNCEFKSNKVIQPKDTEIKGNVLSFSYQYSGQTFFIKTENYIKKFDEGERRIEAHIIQEDIIYPLLEGEIRNIVLYNF